MRIQIYAGLIKGFANQMAWRPKKTYSLVSTFAPNRAFQLSKAEQRFSSAVVSELATATTMAILTEQVFSAAK